MTAVRSSLNHSPDIRQKSSNIEVGSYLNRPVVFTDFSIWVSAWSASLLLDMKSDLPTPSAKGMGLITPLTKRTGSLGLKKKYVLNEFNITS